MKIKDTNCCQSCDIPFGEAHKQYIAKNADGSDSIFCIYCYRDGKFVYQDDTPEDMIEMGVPYLTEKIGEKAAREQLSELIPTLKRWKDKE